MDKRTAAGKKNQKKGSEGSKKLMEFSLFVFLVLAISYILVTFVTQRTRVNGTSMESTLYDGDNIMMDKLSYRFRSPRRKEIVCFYSANKKEILIKRIIGLPGERVKIEKGSIYIDGKLLNDYIGGLNYAGIAAEEIRLGEDEYFCLGDNRGASIDSRYAEIGNVKREDMLGRAFLLYYPFNRIRIVK
ncbi:MAG: signal peptidase I [Lachnospiraceae bacterium]|nr:signal peptidase I [Lachnospiraceae bacterium]